MQEIGTRIKEIRTFFKITQKEFADRTLVTPSYISKVETGKEIPSELFIKLAALEFKISYEWLKTGIGEMDKISVNDELYRDNPTSKAVQTGFDAQLSTLSSYINACNEYEQKKFFDIFIELTHYSKQEPSPMKTFIINALRDIFCSACLMMEPCLYSIDSFEADRAERRIEKFKHDIEETLTDIKNVLLCKNNE